MTDPGALTRFVDPRGAMVGEYRIERPIAWGGMGVVYLAENPLLGSRAAAKVLREELAAYPGIAERFLEEASAASKIRHPNTVQIYDLVSLPDGRPCILMEYLEGETLEKRASAGPMRLARARPILLQISAALGATHARGIVHRDLKAENVLLVSREGRDDFVKLLDFGLAKSTAIAAGVSVPGTLAGTPFYMAPEQVRGEGVDARTDLYALGVLAYRVLVGRFPFEGQNVEEIMYKQVHAAPDLTMLNAPAAAVLGRALAKRPEGRFESALDFARALSDVPAEPAPPPATGEWMQAPTASPAAARTPAPAPAAPKGDPEAPADRYPMYTIEEQLAAMPELTPVPIAMPLPVVAPPLPRASPTADTPPPPWEAFKMPSSAISLPGNEPVPHLPGVHGADPWEPSSFKMPTSAISLPGLAPAPPPAPPRDLAPPAWKVAKPAPPPPSPPQQPPARVLERYLMLSDRDHYAFLSLPEAASAEAIQEAARRTQEELEGARARANPHQRSQFGVLLARLGRAQKALGEGEARAVYDSRLGNYKGVACALLSGLAWARLEALHEEYATRFPDRIARAQAFIADAETLTRAGERKRAQETLEQALALDPLSPVLQRWLASTQEA